MPAGIVAQISQLEFKDSVRQDAILPRSFSISLQLSGTKLECWLNGEQRVTSRPATAIAMALAEEVSFGGVTPPGTNVESLVIQLNPERLNDADLASSVNAAIVETKVKVLKINASILKRAERAIIGDPTDQIERLHAESLVLELVATALAEFIDARPHGEKYPYGTEKKIARIRDLIVEDTLTPFTLESLAQHGGVSVSTLTSKFPEIVGMPVFDFVRDVRLDLARDLISSQGWSISAAAHRIGYAHASNFSAAFRRKYGYPPSLAKKR